MLKGELEEHELVTGQQMSEEKDIYKRETLKMRLELQTLADNIEGYQNTLLEDIRGLLRDNTQCFRACIKAR